METSKLQQRGARNINRKKPRQRTRRTCGAITRYVRWNDAISATNEVNFELKAQNVVVAISSRRLFADFARSTRYAKMMLFLSRRVRETSKKNSRRRPPSEGKMIEENVPLIGHKSGLRQRSRCVIRRACFELLPQSADLVSQKDETFTRYFEWPTWGALTLDLSTHLHAWMF